MKPSYTFFLFLLIYSCAGNEQNKPLAKIQPPANKEAWVLFGPTTVYYTSTLKEANPAWEEKGYSVFQAKFLDSTGNEKFELLDVYGNDDNIVVFNQIFQEGERLKHVILDTLCNYYNAFAGKENLGHSVGVFHKEELAGINTKGLDGKSIISVVQMLSSYQADIDSAIARSKKQKRDPFDVVDAKRNLLVLKAWAANTKTKKIETLKE